MRTVTTYKTKRKMNFERLAVLRKDNKHKQSELAKILGTTQRNYSHMERGEINIPCDTLIKLSTLYSVSIDYILGITDEMKPYPRTDTEIILKEYKD